MQELSGNKKISPLVVKQRIDLIVKAAVGQEITDPNSIHAKAQAIARFEVQYMQCFFCFV